MKIQLTPKETRKLTSAIGLIDATLAKYPTPNWVLASTRSISHKFDVNEDGSSQIEIHEKSFSTFLDSGSEAAIKVGQLAKETFAKFAEVVKEFNADMEDADKSISERGTGFTDSEEGYILVQGINVPLDAVPYPVRLQAAILAVKDGVRDSAKAAVLFQVKEEDITSAFPA